MELAFLSCVQIFDFKLFAKLETNEVTSSFVNKPTIKRFLYAFQMCYVAGERDL